MSTGAWFSLLWLAAGAPERRAKSVNNDVFLKENASLEMPLAKAEWIEDIVNYAQSEPFQARICSCGKASKYWKNIGPGD